MPQELAREPPAARAWSATNLVGVPTDLIGSTAFDRHPVRLSIAGTCESARGLFALLEKTASIAQAAEIFEHFMQLTFGLKPDPLARERSERLRYRANYRKLLEGWGFDSNGPQGAVLKGWVESRFGLVPTYHGGALARFPCAAWIRYIEQKMMSRFHGNCINLQLVLLYEYCQWAAQRFGVLQAGHSATIPVWRGVDSLDEHRIVSGSLRSRQAIVHLNNVVSFSLSRSHAEQFGNWILATSVPVPKLLFFPHLLGRSILSGEGEVIALGGQYEVQASYY